MLKITNRKDCTLRISSRNETNNLRETWKRMANGNREDGRLSSASLSNETLENLGRWKFERSEMRDSHSPRSRSLATLDKSPAGLQLEKMRGAICGDSAECRVLRNGGDPRKDTCRNKPRAYNSF